MPQKKFRMFLSSKNTQTTAYHRFHAIRQDQSRQDFQMNAGCCGNRNPLIGWRKEQTCCLNKGIVTPNSLGWQMVLKNVQDCCKPSQLKMIQNRAASSPEQTALNGGKPYSVSGKIDRNYNYNYRQYLKKRCMIADYDNRSGGRQRSAVKYPPSSQQVLEASCCTTTCCKCVHYATYQIFWAQNNPGSRPSAHDILQDAYGNRGTIIEANDDTATFMMDCVLFALRGDGPPYLYLKKGGDDVAKFGTLLSVRLGGCHEPGSHIPSDMLTYKRSNWGFRKQGAVDNGLYIATKKIYANPCCAGVLETSKEYKPGSVTPEPPNPANPPNPQDQTQLKKEEVEVPRPPVLAKEPGKVVENRRTVKK